MNKKVIRAVLRKKFNQWTATIKDERVKSLVEKNTIITGGCITSMLLGEDVKDFDVYFTDRNTTKAVADYYVKEFLATHPGMDIKVVEEIVPCEVKPKKYSWDFDSPSTTTRVKVLIQSKGVAGEVDTEEHPIFEDAVEVLGEESKGAFRPVFLSSNAITLSDKMQLVLRFYGDAKEIHTNYDFVHCTNYWTSKDNEVVLNLEAVTAILNKRLVYTGSKYPLCSIIRTRKFISRGWHIDAGQYLKMIMQVSELDLKSVAVLEDQLCGVDSTYFNILIDALKNGGNDSTVSSSYVAEIVDRIFN